MKRTLVICVIFFNCLFCQEKIPGLDSLIAEIDELDGKIKAKAYLDLMYDIRDRDILSTLKLFDSALILVTENNFKEEEAELYIIAAGQYNLIADPLKAIQLYQRSISIYDSLGLTERSGVAHNNLGWVYGTLGDVKNELRQYKLAYNLVTKAGNKFYSASMLSNIGDSYKILDSLELAMTTQLEVLSLFQELDNKFRIGITYRKISELNFKMGNYREGISNAEKSVKLLSAPRKDLELQKSLRSLAFNYMSLRRFSKALKLSDEAISISRNLNGSLDQREELKKNYLMKMEILFRMGELNKAREYIVLAEDYADTLISNRDSRIIKIFKERYDLEKRKSEANAVELKYQKNYALFLIILLVIIVVASTIVLNAYYTIRRMNKTLKNQKNKLELLNKEFNAFFDHSNRAIRVINSKGEIILWNKAAENLTGIKSSVAIGMDMLNLFKQKLKFHDSRHSKLRDLIKYLNNSPAMYKKFDMPEYCNIRMTIQTANGDVKHIYDSIFFIKTSTEVYLGGITTDITKQTENEEKLVLALEKAEETDKLKSEFLSQISHEIRTPVNSILNLSQLIAIEVKEKLQDPSMLECVESIDRSSQRLIRTIETLLQVSELQSGKYISKPKDLYLQKDILHNVALDYQNVTKDLDLIWSDTLKFNKVTVDPFALTQVLHHLIDNAIKYTEAGYVKISSELVDGKVVISVEDTGLGIEEQYLKDIFKPFTQEEQGYTRRFEGTGLGLSLVKQYCDLSNIGISVNSKKNKGTTFKLEIN